MSFTTASLRSFLITGLISTATAGSHLRHQHHQRRAPDVVVSVEETIVELVTVFVTAGGAAAAATTAPSTTLATVVSAPAAIVSSSQTTTTTTTAAVVTTPSVSVPAVVVTTSSAPASSSTSSSSAGLSSKKGLAFNDASLLSAWTSKDAGWAYNWGSAASASVPASIPFVPMIWCTNTPVSTWTAAAKTAIAAGSTHLLSFNEPDQTGQCDISAAAAATAHQTYMNQFKGQAKIGSPAVTNGGGSMGLSFMQSFLSACAGNCALDFLAIHWYAPVTGAVAYFQDHVTQAITLAQQNNISQVWITEFGLTGASTSDEATFLAAVLPWLNSNAGVGGYAYFMVSDSSLMSGTAISNVVGAAYASA